jgi:hypothetical protein
MIFFKRYQIKSIIKKLTAMQHDRLHNQTQDETIAKEHGLYNTLIGIYQSLIGHKHYPFAHLMVIECLRTSAHLDDAVSQYTLAVKLLDEAKLRVQLETDRVFSNPNNQRLIDTLYQEVHALLSTAEKNNHTLAKRLRGVCYINGWGVLSDKAYGFELVVQSIELENSWDNIPQIFATIGLNKPEFFSALVKHRPQQA